MPGGSWGIRKHETRIFSITLQFRQLRLFTGRSRILTSRIARNGQDSTHKKATQIYNQIKIYRRTLHQVCIKKQVPGLRYQVSHIIYHHARGIGHHVSFTSSDCTPGIAEKTMGHTGIADTSYKYINTYMHTPILRYCGRPGQPAARNRRLKRTSGIGGIRLRGGTSIAYFF